MAVKLDVQKFAGDYRKGISDRELLAKYKISAPELVALVKKLIHGGQISKEDYFERNRRIDELRAIREKDFLKSLHHCPVCSHVHPTPFTTCPACGTDITEYEKAQRSEEMAIEKALEEKYDAKSRGPQSTGTGKLMEAAMAAAQPPVMEETPEEQAPVPPSVPAAVPKIFQNKAGMSLKDLSWLDATDDASAKESYQLGEMVSVDAVSALFEGQPKSGQSGPVLIKIFDPFMLPGPRIGEFFEGLTAYQSGMDDANILKVVGKGSVGAYPALVYEYMPTNLEIIIGQHEEGLPIETMMTVLPQILNALGYSHMHRGSDGKVRRLPHLHLRPSKFLFDEKKQVAKLEDCAVWRSLVEVRGYKKRLWEEPGVDVSALAPEGFVIDSKFINPFLVDIYALGALLYRLATGQSAFSCSNHDEYRFEHLRKFAIPPRVHRYGIPRWLDEMILKCLEKEPGQRWRSATQMELAIKKDVLH
jgi:serine/threonine protein kinase